MHVPNAHRVNGALPLRQFFEVVRQSFVLMQTSFRSYRPGLTKNVLPSRRLRWTLLIWRLEHLPRPENLKMVTISVAILVSEILDLVSPKGFGMT